MQSQLEAKTSSSTRAVAGPAIDWESPAGPVDERAQPRMGLTAFYFMGPGDTHWIGQQCDVLGSPTRNPSAVLIRLACGCCAAVPRTSLVRA
jgi:hypothetical protein